MLRLIRWLSILIATGFLGLLIYGIAAEAPDRTIDDALARADAIEAPGFELPVLAGGEVPVRLTRALGPAGADRRIALSELRGTPVVLNFWASWCDPCRVEAPILERGWREYGPHGVLFVGLDMQDAPDDARGFLRDFSITYPNVHEAGKETARHYGATGLPETFFISARGSVVGHVIGVVSAKQLRAGVDAARSGRPAPPAAGGASESAD